ncbi:MAG: NAD(P)/FAD-dependent oxidoreductase [Devosia sp.]|uniref:dihydrolipoyl dehydrogenase family protein n=1 Tax=Devosia sp. TaxID=1871048 RepID=UPI001ACD85FE|nr:NAD(P)/FAD-dependent oxidoreductase [Devosia sp.]MBN9314934.1 NAD(P)/FAD-dependent oxidoreductase [Devosia sp.]
MADILTPDLCVIGAGSSGIAVAERARAYGASVVLVEQGRIGGNALNTGAVPAKALAAAGAHARALRDGPPFGIAAEDPKVNFRRVHDHIDQVIAALAPQSSAAHLMALGIDVIEGAARFISRKAVAVGDTEIRARHFVVATGARWVAPTIPGLDAVPYFTPDTILDNTRKLTHLVVIGSGVTAIELAQAYNRLGTEVTVVAGGELLPGFDPELAAVALATLAEEGVHLEPHAAVSAVQARSMGIGVAIRTGESDRLLDASHILVAGGRAPNVAALDLDKAGIRLDAGRAGALQLNGALRTTNARVYAVGDVTGGESVPSAARAAEAVVRSALLGAMARPDRTVPRLVSTDPAIAEIGLNEVTARTRHGVGFRVTRWAFADNDQARASRQTHGLAKLLTDRRGSIIGAGVVGPGASELVALFALAMSGGLKGADLAAMSVPYPSFAEIAVRLGAELRRGDAPGPLLRAWMAVNRLLG